MSASTPAFTTEGPDSLDLPAPPTVTEEFEWCTRCSLDPDGEVGSGQRVIDKHLAATPAGPEQIYLLTCGHSVAIRAASVLGNLGVSA